MLLIGSTTELQAKESDIREIVKTFLTENLGWYNKGLCIYHKLLSEDLVYLAGPCKKVHY